MRFPLPALVAAALALAGCGSAPTPPPPDLTFAGPPDLTVASDSGALTIALWWSPSQPTVGYAASQMSITDAAGAPVAGATVTVVPFMPAHGHGGSVLPTVTESSPGVYVATPLAFYMSGTWQLRTRIQDAGDAESIDDTAAPSVDVP